MSDEFRSKLEAYEKGQLSEKETEEFELELEKLEKYQEFLEENKLEDRNVPLVDEKKQKKILTRGKWKARIQTAIMALLLLVVVTIVSSILTAVYYQWGSPDRVEVLRNVIDHTLTITDPHGHLGGTSTNANAFFRLEASRDLRKRVGHETMKVGELEVNFLLSMMAIPQFEYYGESSRWSANFSHPDYVGRGFPDWNRLEQLPEGTVVSANLSFTELMETKDVIHLFSEKEIDITWLPVDTGEKNLESWFDGFIHQPIGFPPYPIWHDDDMILLSREEEKWGWGGKVISEGYSSPDYDPGDQTVLHEQFLKTLYFLKGHEKKVDTLFWGKMQLDERIQYLEQNGFFHYGVVITGPSKEVLKLKEEEWVRELEVDEVAFWNWNY